MANILETIMLVCFGMSWPVNAVKAYRARTAKGVSLGFYILIIIGYLSGILAKIVGHNINYVLIIYFINIAMILINIALYFRNKKIDSREG